jgi:flavin reductase (DIM6/NTAB) family NADH-FMN oxidoreductase RutF
MQVSFDPLRLALSINPHHSSYRLLKEGQAFSVNVLKKGQLELAAHYGVGEEGHPDFHVVSACSGHGFKHAPAVGEAVAMKALGLKATLDTSTFGAARFQEKLGS